MQRKSIYLCGPINGCTDEECNNWREYVIDNYDGPTINPMRRDYRGREAESVHEIVELDKIDVTDADVILVMYDKPSVGTSMEVLYAFERGKMVVVVASTSAKMSPWMVYHSHKISHSLDDALEFIKGFSA